MRTIALIALFLLLVSGLWLGQYAGTLRREIRLQSDSLAAIRQRDLAQQSRGRLSAPAAALLGEAPLQVDSLLREVHRISADYFNTLYLVRLELGRDSTLRLIFKKCTVQHPLTGEGKYEVLAHTERVLDASVLQSFRTQLTGIDFLNAAQSDDVFCCFGGGTLSLESVLPSGKRLWFSTYCRQSEQFAEACEYVLRQVPDPTLQAALKR
ncbi:MAG: hypothetical protein IT260_17170 [Saprospiraceae bacterium]|nr:hypothetical protein [Saprospiraceae bacterium]